MARKKVRSVFQDLYPEDQAARWRCASLLLQGLGSWLAGSGMTQAEAAKILSVTQARGLRHQARQDQFLQPRLLVRLAARAGLNPRLKLVA